MLLHYGIYIILGICAGTLSGLLGVGGGIIIVPAFIVLFESYGFPSSIIMHCAAGTSLAAMIVTSAFSVYAHARRGVEFGSILYKMIPGLVLGTAAGTIVSFYSNSHVLRVLFGLLLIWVAFKEFFIKSSKKFSEDEVGKVPHSLVIIFGTSLIGIVSGLLGIGGGTMIVPFLQKCGMTIRRSISLSTVCGLVIAITGTLGFILVGFNEINLPPYSLGFVYFPAALGVAIGSPLFAFFGTYLHHHFKVTVIKRLFGVFMFVIGIKLLI